MCRLWIRAEACSAVLLATVVLSSCVPAVTHGPRVEPGWGGGFTVSLPFGPRYSEGDWGQQPFLYGPIGVNLNHGWRSADSLGGAFQLGVHLPATLVFFPAGLIMAQADLYYQLPQGGTGTMAAGAGANVSGDHLMPYIQLGGIGANGSGWYTTQGAGFYWNASNFGPNVFSTIVWLPTLAYQVQKGGTTTHFFVSAGLGKATGDCYDRDSCQRDEVRRLLTAGLTLQFHRRR